MRKAPSNLYKESTFLPTLLQVGRGIAVLSEVVQTLDPKDLNTIRIASEIEWILDTTLVLHYLSMWT